MEYSRQSGFSLIEIMAASMVLGLVIVGVTTMLGTGRDLEYKQDLQRQARIKVSSALEDSTLHISRHNSSYSPFMIVGTQGSFQIIKETVVQLDSGRTNPVPASLRVGFYDESMVLSDSTIPYRRVIVSMGWSAAGLRDTIEVTKRIPKFAL